MTKQAALKLHERITQARLVLRQKDTPTILDRWKAIDEIASIMDILIFEAIDKSDLHPETAEKYWIEEESL